MATGPHQPDSELQGDTSIRVHFMEYNNICSSEINSGAGRPHLEVEKEDILLLKRLNYSWTRVAEMLDISRPTLYRRLIRVQHRQ